MKTRLSYCGLTYWFPRQRNIFTKKINLQTKTLQVMNIMWLYPLCAIVQAVSLSLTGSSSSLTLVYHIAEVKWLANASFKDQCKNLKFCCFFCCFNKTQRKSWFKKRKSTKTIQNMNHVVVPPSKHSILYCKIRSRFCCAISGETRDAHCVCVSFSL